MKLESLVFALSGMFFGLFVGWMIGTQQRPAGPAPAPPAAQGGQTSQATTPPAPLDRRRVEELTAAAERAPDDPATRAELGNVYFDAERYDEAIRWYEEALRLDPRDVNVSTDLGVAYYYTSQPERALKQFEHSLSVDPRHTKTMLNVGIVRAFGMQDLAGAGAAWRQLIEVAPDSPEGRAARQALESLRTAHPEVEDGRR